jgi:hypothetical protein
MAAERERAEAAAKSGQAGTDLVVVKEQIIRDRFKALGIRLRSASSSYTVRDGGAFRSGAEAGGRVGLGRPVPGSGSGGRTLPRGK